MPYQWAKYINTLCTQITNKQKCSENVLISLRMWIINKCLLKFDKNKIKNIQFY